MRDALTVVWYGLRDLWDEFLLLMMLNLLWAAAAILPALPLLALGRLDVTWIVALCLPLAVPLPVVWGALCFVANQVARGKAVSWDTFKTGVRRYWAKSLAVAGINLAALLLLAVNWRFYSLVLQGELAVIALGAWLLLGAYWLLVQVFWFPMILELENERVFHALRSALVLVIVTPGFTLTLAAALVLIGALCGLLAVPIALVMVSLFSLIGNHATRSRLAFARKQPYRPGAPQA